VLCVTHLPSLHKKSNPSLLIAPIVSAASGTNNIIVINININNNLIINNAEIRVILSWITLQLGLVLYRYKQNETKCSRVKSLLHQANDVRLLWRHSSRVRSRTLECAYRRPFLTVFGEFEPQNVVGPRVDPKKALPYVTTRVFTPSSVHKAVSWGGSGTSTLMSFVDVCSAALCSISAVSSMFNNLQIIPPVWLGGVVVRALDLQLVIRGSIQPLSHLVGQVVHTYFSLSPSSTIW